METPKNETNAASVVLAPADAGGQEMYIVSTASQNGDDEKSMSLDDAVDYLMEVYRTKQMFINVNEVMFHPVARFSGTPEDNKIVQQDRMRLRNLILTNTIKVEGQPAVKPDIQVYGRIKGGGLASTPVDTQLVEEVDPFAYKNFLSAYAAKRIATKIAEDDAEDPQTLENRVLHLTKIILAEVNSQ